MADTNFLGSLFQPTDQEDRYALPPLPGQQAVKPQEMPEVPAAKALPAIKPEAPADSPADTRAGTAPATETRRPQKVERWLPPQDLVPLFEKSAQKYDVPVNVLMAIAHQESRYNPSIIGKEPTQWGRAKGLMQYLDGTAQGLGINPFDPEQSIDAAAKQISQRLKNGASMEDAVKEHFAGPDRKKWGTKTAAYGREVMDKVGKIGEAMIGGSTGDTRPSDRSAMNKAPEVSTDGLIQITPAQAARIEAGENPDLVLAKAPDATDEPIQPARGILQEYITDPLKRGMKGMQQGFKANSAMFNARQLEAIGRIDRGEAVKDADDVVGYQYMTPEQRADIKKQLGSAFQSSVKDVTDLGKEIKTIPQDPDVAAASQAKSFNEWWTHFKKAPFKFIANTGVESLPNMVPGLVLGGGAGLASQMALKGGALVAGAAGMGAGSYAVDYPSTVMSALQDLGIDTTNADALSQAFADPKIMEDVRKQAHAHASVVGTLDAVSGGRAGATIVAGKTLARKAANLGAKTLEQGALGGAGEAGGQLAQGKTELEWGPIMGEFAGEVAGAPAEIAGAGYAKAKEAAAKRMGGNQQAQDTPAAEAAPAGPTTPPPAAAPAGPAQPAPSTASGPLGRATEKAAGTAPEQPRVTVTAPEGQVTGAVQSYQEDGQGGFTAQILGDDGQVYAFTEADGVQVAIEQPKPGGPLTGAIEKAADVHTAGQTTEQIVAEREQQAVADTKAPFETGEQVLWSNADHDLPVEFLGVEAQPGSDGRTYARVIQDGQESFVPADELARPTEKPAKGSKAAPRAPAPKVEADLTAMSEDQLRERLKYIAGQAKSSGGWNKRFIEERRRVEKEIGARAKDQSAAAPDDTRPTATTFTDQAEANSAMLKAAESTGKLHEVVERDGKFVVQPLQESSDAGSDTAGLRVRDERDAGAQGAAQVAQDNQPGNEAGKKPDPVVPTVPGIPVSSARADLSGGGKAANAKHTLSKDLAGAKPRYSYGTKQFDLTFANDIDRAAYIAAQKTPSKRDGDYVKFVSDATGMTEAQVREHGAKVRDAIRGQAKDAEPGKLGVPAVHGAEAAAAKDIAAGKWFGSQEKADGFIAKKQLGGSHEVVQTGKVRFEVKPKAAAAIDTAAHEAATSQTNDRPEPTQAQRDAGNYKKGNVSLHGMDIAIENPRGSTRSGTGPDGKTWSKTMSDHYGYVRRTMGADGDQVDVYVGPKPESDRVYVVDQIDQQTGRFDEHKTMLGYSSQAEAIAAYSSNFDKGWKVGPVTEMSVDEFKSWLKDGDTSKPANDNATTQRDEAQRNIFSKHLDEITDTAEAKAYIAALRAEIMTSERTGLGSNRAWMMRKPKKFVASIDLDSLKWVNDNMGHAAGDKMIAGMGDALRAAGLGEDAFHVSGDEFYAHGNDATALRNSLKAAQEAFRKHTIEDNGITFTGPGFSFGIGEDIANAENLLHEDKRAREEAGERAARGEQPRGVAQASRPDQVAGRGKGNRAQAGADAQGEVAAPKGDTIVEVKDVYGRKHRVRQTDLDGEADRLPTVRKNGDVVIGEEIPRSIIEAKAEKPAEPKAASAPDALFADNKLFTADKVAAARARLKSKLSQLNSGLDPEIMMDGITIAGAYLEAGTRKFSAYAKAMTDDFGDAIKPYLLSFYEGARHFPGLETDGMSTPETAKKHHDALLAEVAEVAKPTKPATMDSKEGTQSDVQPNQAGARQGTEGQAGKPVRADDGGRDAGPLFEQAGRADRQPGGGGAQRASERPAVPVDQRPATEGAGSQQPDQVGRGGRAEPGDRGNRQPRSGVSNYRIKPGELKREGSWRATAERNVGLIALVKKLETEGRQATPEERAQLARFTGWGASEIANGIFPDKYGRYKDAQWQALGERLKAALTPEEYAAARRTTQYAHYTSESVIRSIYAGLDRLGFKGGTVLEPGMGVGSFNGLMPDHIAANSHYTGIEYEPLTGAIAKALYPESNVIVGDYTRTNLPKDFFDAAIGNPPFSQTVIANDPEYKNRRPMLHDYFFMKTIDRVKPGGLLVFVTSKGTMDKASDKSRKYLAERANLLGAIRLPQTAFKDNAGTEVVTDVIFLQKRGEGVADNGVNWLDTKEVATPQGPTAINEYFAEHPEMVLGTHALTGSMYRANEYTVLPLEGDIEAHFAKAVEKLPENVTRPARGSAAERALVQDRDFNPKHKKEGGLYLSDDGKLMQVEDGSGVEVTHRAGADAKPIALTPKQKQWLKGYVGVRDALKQTQFDQLNDGDWEKSLAALNKAYDAFVKEHGPILDYTTITRESMDDDGNVTTTETKRYKNDPLLRLDVEGALAHALERIREDGTIEKGAAQLGRVLERAREPEIKTTQDALFVSLNRHGSLNLDDVAALAGTDKESVIRDLGTAVYEGPGTGWQLADEYLSGNVVRKLKEAQSAAEIDPRYKRNVDALLAVQPRPLGPTEITVRLGANWVPASDVAMFASEALGDKMDVTYNPILGNWGVEQQSRNVSEWGFDKMSAGSILESVLNSRQIKVTFRDQDGKTHVDVEATEKANDIASKMRERFRTWLWTSPKRADRLTKYYNEHFNNIAPRQFDGSHLTLPGVSTRYTLHPHQKRAVWRVIQQGDTYLAHAVGAGKTMEMIAAGMEERRLGLVNKPAYVVPNHMLAQFSREFLELYPAANIMVADEHNFHTHNRKRFVAQAALNDPDAIIITHSAFGRISMSDEFSNAFITKQIDAWKEALDDAKGDRITTKQIERRIEQLERRLEGRQGKERKDKVLDFEELGVDKLYVDEFHEFRKLDFATNQGNVKGVDPNGSQRALDLYMKTEYLRGKKPGRALVAASGTPVTNTMGELYTAQRFFQPEQLKEDGLDTFDAWSAQYGDVVTGFEQNAAGGYEMVSRFAKFQNVPELMRRVRSFMDILTSNNLGALVKRPDVIGGGREVVVTPVPDGYKEYQQELQARIQAIRNRKGPPKKGEDIILNVIGDGRFSAIDMRFVDPSRPSDPTSKLNTTIDDIISAYKETADFEFSSNGKADPIKGSSIVLFTDIGLGEASATNRGFDMRAWIEKRLKDAGIPAEHIAFMRDHKQHSKKERLFADMREGKRRILIGGKEMETGTNVQKRLSHLFHLDAPWFPASVEQREGRIIRQGNQNQKVKINAYATKGSYDSTMWGMNARKARFIEQAMNGDDSVRSMEDVSEASAFEMAAALASGDERYLKLAGLKTDVERLERLRHAHFSDQNSLRREKHWAEDLVKHNEKKAAELTAAIAKRTPIKAGEFEGKVGKKTHDSREEFSQAAFKAFKELGDENLVGERQLGEIGGFPITFYGAEQKGSGAYIASLHVGIPGDPDPLVVYPIDPGMAVAGIATRAANQVNGLDRELQTAQGRAAEQKRKIEQIKSRLGAAFPEEAILMEKVAELNALQEELAKEGEAANAEAAAATVEAEGDQPSGDDGEVRYSAAPGKRLGKGYVFHNTTTDALKKIMAEGMDAGSFSRRPIDFGGDVWIAVKESDLPGYQEHDYGGVSALEPNWERKELEYDEGMNSVTKLYRNSIPADKIIVVDKKGAPIEEPRYSVNDGKPEAEFGKVHTEFRDDAASAIRRLMKDKGGEAVAAVVRPDIGEVSLVYGNEHAGLQHIATRRGADILKRLPDLLKSGNLYEKADQIGRVFIGNAKDEAAIRLDWNGEAKTWLVSAYELHPDQMEKKSGPASTTNLRGTNAIRATRRVPESRRSEVVMQRTAGYGKQEHFQAVRAALEAGQTGGVVSALIAANRIKLYDTSSKLPKSVSRGVRNIQAVTDGQGVIHMVTSSVTPANANAVLLHEMQHGGVEKLIGSVEWGKLQGRLGSLYRQAQQSKGRAREFFDAGRERVQSAKDAGAVARKYEVEEFGAYIIEEYENAPPSFRKWVDDLIGTIKAWLVKRFGIQAGQVTPAQLRAFAVAALRNMNEAPPTGTDGPRFSVKAEAAVAPASDKAPAATGAKAELEGFTPPEQGFLRNLQSVIQDNMNRLKQVQDRIAKMTGRESLGRADYYGAETNRPGRVAARLEDMEKDLTGPLMQRLAKSGHTQEQLSELLHATHAEERNARVAEINEAMPDGGSGMTNAEANTILAKYADNKALHAIAQQARDIARATLDLKLAYGLITADDHDTLSKAYENYVPLKGDGEYGPKVKRAMGHEGRDEHILENIARDYEQAVVVGERNTARQSLLQLVLEYPDDALWSARVPPRGRYVAGQVYNVVHRGETVASFTSRSQVSAFLEAKGVAAGSYEVLESNGDRVKEFVKPLQGNEVMVYVKGDPVRLQIMDEKLAAQLRPLDQGKMHPILEFMRGMNRYLSKIYTGYNPAFILRNTTRDAMTGTINMLGNQGVGVAAKAWGKYPGALKTLGQWAATGKTPATEQGKLLTEYRMHGGKVGASWMSDLEEQGKTLSRMYEDAYGASGYLKDGKRLKAAKVAGRKIVGGMAHVVEIANQATENALRLSLFMALREQGVTADKAAQAAKTVTVDFDRKGSQTGALGAIYLFFNPAVQGTANALKTLSQGKHKEQAFVALGALALLGLYAASQGMDDDKDRWLGEGWDTRTKNFILKVGSHQLRVPLSQEFAPVYAAGVAIGEAFKGEDKMRSAVRLVSSFIDAYFPLQGAYHADSDNHQLDAALAAVPTIIKPHVQAAVNRNNFGSQIVPGSETTKDRPDNLKMFRGTKNTAYDAAAQQIASVGQMLGAGKYENDITKVSPETLKMLWRNYTGGLGQFVTDTIGVGSMAASDPSQVDAGDVPIIKDFWRSTDVKPIRSRYYDLAREAHQAATEFEQAKKAGDGEAMDAILSRPEKAELIGLGRLVRSTNKAVGAIRDEEVDINADASLTPGQKRERLKEIEKTEEELYRSAIGVLRK